MARKTKITVRKRGPDYGTAIAIVVIAGFVVAAAFGHTPNWVK